jgi:hypothetical protein
MCLCLCAGLLTSLCGCAVGLDIGGRADVVPPRWAQCLTVLQVAHNTHRRAHIDFLT